MTDPIEDIHRFWFGELDDAGMCSTDRHPLWFTASEATDEACRSRFRPLLDQALTGALEPWADTDRGLVALVVLLDQFSRNIHRGTAAAFAGDSMALKLSQRAIASGRHQRLPTIHQAFLFLPLEHNEDLEVQEECVTLFEELAAVTGDEQIADFTRYAHAHREVIGLFGRFPHRNEILGRRSSEEELAYLEKHGGF